MNVRLVSNNDRLQNQVNSIRQILTRFHEHSGETIVIKVGGTCLNIPRLLDDFINDIVLLKEIGVNPVVVHGDSRQVNKKLVQFNMESTFVEGVRVTDQSTMEAVEMILTGHINKDLVTRMIQAGGMAIGLSGKDGKLIEARKVRRTKRSPNSNVERILDLGYVGEPTQINAEIITALEDTDMIPVISPIGLGEHGETFNLNADQVAASLASALSASTLVILDDCDPLTGSDPLSHHHITVPQVRKHLKERTLPSEQLVRLECCMQAVEAHSNMSYMIDGRIPHALLLTLFQGNLGTMVTL